MESSLSDIVEKITQYIHVKTELIKLKLISFIARVVSNLIALFTISLIGIFFILFLSFGIGAYLNELIESSYAGYFIVSAFYLVLIILMFILLKAGSIQRWLEALIVKIVEQEDEQED